MQRRWERSRLVVGAKMEIRQSLSSFYLIGDGKGYGDRAFVAFGTSWSLAGVMQIGRGTNGSCVRQMAG
jgi:hypothetical protein